MEVLHINVAYICDKFYETFYDHLLLEGIQQTVYVPYKKADYENVDLDSIINRRNDLNVIASPIKTTIDRLFYFTKINKYFNDIETKSNHFEGIELIHAHSLFSDGGVAYYASEKYNIPFVVAIRTADTEFFLKYMKYLKPFMVKILTQAKKIIFINPNLKKQIMGIITDENLKMQVDSKSDIIPNGIDRFWIENRFKKTDRSYSKIKLLHVGRLIKRKNQKLTLLTTADLVKRGYDVNVDIIGAGKDLKQLIALSKKLKIQDRVVFHGYIQDKQYLLKLYRSSDYFLLPSYTETFGIAYIEAMSQGLPVIYSKNQGIDGYFKELEVGCSVNSNSFNDMSDAILRIRERYDEISKRSHQKSMEFDWQEIAQAYYEVYENSVKMY
jgi:L-malate glycosyltransferase